MMHEPDRRDVRSAIVFQKGLSFAFTAIAIGLVAMGITHKVWWFAILNIVGVVFGIYSYRSAQKNQAELEGEIRHD